MQYIASRRGMLIYFSICDSRYCRINALISCLTAGETVAMCVVCRVSVVFESVYGLTLYVGTKLVKELLYSLLWVCTSDSL